MSTKKAALPKLPKTPQWAPSTPHAIRALQQRSGGRRKSANINRRDSAHNILRRLARVTAAQTRRSPSTPPVKSFMPPDKENVYSPFISQSDENSENEEILERPDFTLPIEEAEVDEDLGVAPMRRELPGGEDYTFMSTNFPAQHARPPTSVRSERIRIFPRISTVLSPGRGDAKGLDDEDDFTAHSIEYGRRAISEGPAWDRYPRSSFGSIRMSEFGLENSRLGKQPEREKSLVLDDQDGDMGAEMDDEMELNEGDETENLPRFRQSMSEPVDDGLFVQSPVFPDDEITFRLDFARDRPRSDSPGSDVELEGGDAADLADDAVPSEFVHQTPGPVHQSPSGNTRQMTEIEGVGPSRVPRRKKLRLTRRGNTVPALPSSLVKRIAIESMSRIGKSRPTISRESLTALKQASEWFFEQVGEDLEAYSNHAKRKKRIDDMDVLTLMKRQRVIGRDRSLEALAQEYLPDEVLVQMNLPDDGF